jgi:hypothetical protein
MRYDFTYVQAAQARARRERSEAVHRIVIAPLVALISRLFKPHAAKHPAARPHLARQG